MAEGVVIWCHNTDQLNEQLAKHVNSQKLLVMDFSASWCGPCRAIAPIVAEFAKKFTNVSFIKIDVDELKVVAQELRVEALPTFMFLKKGRFVDKVVGAKKDELHETK
ncbi:hypothetical protein E3N88_20897 [Mikania micrantha]|uniref:Thioredoxin n=1 Tax=Mikania micrantha TaxID=192012 RepID=A0A5N6NIT1_9ASTR|nr:hypothetical protein E3N88_20897 [Mikania micrantha]